MADIRLQEMFPDLGEEITDLRGGGYSDEQILRKISTLQGEVRREKGATAAQSVFNQGETRPVAPLSEVASEGLKRGISWGVKGKEFEMPPGPEGFVGTMTDPAVLTNIVSELAGQAPYYLALGPLMRLLGGASFAGASPMTQKFISHGVAPAIVTAGGRAAGGVAKTGELPPINELMSPEELILFGLFGVHSGLGVGRQIAKAGRVLDMPAGALRNEAIEAVFHKPGEFKFSSPELEDITRKVLKLPPSETGAVGRAAKAAEPLTMEAAAEALRSGKLENTYHGLEPGRLVGESDNLFAEAARMEISPETGPIPIVSTAAAPAPGRGAAIPQPGRVGAQTALPPLTPGTTGTISRLEALREAFRKAVRSSETPRAAAPMPARSVPMEGTLPQGAINIEPITNESVFLRELGVKTGREMEKPGPPTQRLNRGMGERDIPSEPGVTPTLDNPEGKIVPGGQRTQEKVGPAHKLVAGESLTDEEWAELGMSPEFTEALVNKLTASKGKILKIPATEIEEGMRRGLKAQPKNPSTSVHYAEVPVTDLNAETPSSLAANRLENMGGNKAVQRLGDIAKGCKSPCVDVKLLGSAERAKMYSDLQEVPGAAEQATRAVIAESASLFSRLKTGFTNLRKNFESGSSFTSPSFVLEKFKAGVNIIRGVDEAARGRAIWMGKQVDELYGKMDWKGSRIGGKVNFEQGSLEDIAAGVGLENPEMLEKFNPTVKQGSKGGTALLERVIREYHNLRPNEKIGNIKHYLPHVLDPADLEAAFKADIERLTGSTGKVDAARLAQLQHSLEKLQNGQAIMYDDIPESLRMRFFETRTGRGGYSFSMIKAINTYLASMSRKLYLEPAVQNGLKNMAELPAEYRPYAKEYLRDFLGISDRFRDPSSPLVQGIRELQFVRLIGFNPTSPIRNAFQQLNTLVEVGPRHWKRGIEAAFSKQGGDLFDASGHAADVPQIYLNSEIKMAPRWQKFVSYAGWMFNKVEIGNRKVAYLGGLSRWFAENAQKAGMSFDEALKRGSIPDAAKQFADDVVRKTQFRYGKVDLPFFLRGPIGGTAFQFSSFSLKQAELMWKWIAREGVPGKKKLLAYMGVAAGVATFADLIDLPSLGGANTIPQPVDLNEMFRTAQAMTEGDWAKARAAFGAGTIGAWTRSFSVKIGPTGAGLAEAADLARKAQEGTLSAKLIAEYGVRNVQPAFTRKLASAIEQLEAGGNAKDFVSTVMGFPTGAAIVRRKYLKLLETGRTDTARDMLKAYREARGGNIPLNYEKVAQIKRDVRMQKAKDVREAKKETRSAKITRQFSRDVQRQIL